LLWSFACGSAPDTVRSVPTTPTVVFPDPSAKDQEIVWSDAEGVLPATPGLPAPLAAATPGMAGAAARALLGEVHEPGTKIFGEVSDGNLVLTSVLRGAPNVGVVMILADEGAVLTEVDLTLRDDVAVPMITTRWGAPAATTHGDQARATYRWEPADGPWVVVLESNPDDKALVRFVAREAAAR
ncbi:MAG: hypothetical protein ABMB14_23040, partial [Myxococcota bacterium]